MNKVSILAILAAILANLACIMSAAQIPTATPPPSASPSPVPTATSTPRATEAAADTVAIVRQYSVYVHAEPNVESVEVGWVNADDVVTVLECQEPGDWCRIEEPAGWVYRGCLAGFEEGRGCREAK
jgi:hypothetical protein